MKTTIKHSATLTGLALMAFMSVQCTDKGMDDNKPTQFDLPSITAQVSEYAGTKALVSPEGIVSYGADDLLKVFVETQGTAVEDWEEVTRKYVTNAGDCGTCLFKPETPEILPDLNAKVNLYVMNPWNDAVVDPIGGDESYSEFIFDGQIQDDNDVTSHLKDFTLMTGYAEGVVAGQNPVIKMEHKAALVKFSIENEFRRPLTIQNVEITAPEGVNIAGSYKVDFKPGAELVPVSPKNTTFVTVRNGKQLGADDVENLYLMTPPFKMTAGQILKLTVTSSEGVWDKLITLPADLDVKAGMLNNTTIERTNYAVENIWTKTFDQLGIKSNNILGASINDKYLFIQEYDGRAHLLNRNDGAYLKEVIQGGPYSFMLNADVDDAGHFISSRHHIYGAGFRVFRYDVDSDNQIELFAFSENVPEDMGYGLGVSGDLTKGYACVYGSAPGEPKMYMWEFQDGKLLTPENSPVVIDVQSAAGSTWAIANADRVSASANAEHYIAYLVEGESAEVGGSVFEITDKNGKTVATMDKANTLYRILDFKVSEIAGRTLLVTTEQGFNRWDGVRAQVFDITNRENLSLKPGDAGYEKFCLYTSDEIGVLDYNRWANASIYVDEAAKEVYFTSGAIGNDSDAKSIVRLFNMKFFEN